MKKKDFKKKYPKIYSLIYDPEKVQYRFFIISALILSYAIPYILISEHLEKQAYKKSKVTLGFVKEVDVTHGKGNHHIITFWYKNENNQVFTNTDYNVEHPCADYKKIGDTVTVEYSLTDSDYARIESCYWNETLKREYGFD